MSHLVLNRKFLLDVQKKGYEIAEVESREPERIGGERKMRPLQVGALLSGQIIKEFIFWNFK